ncbi:phage tail protein [Pleomorphovibrio marinus]|uniref:phage tail protein n=1 Tax=Pleomorphovibrio marinus TaxID=2164132 RepID=UPI000E0AAD4A|nr:phage tail protein [Pleomorphovibrio marinus]
MTELQLYRSGNPTIQVKIDDSTTYIHEVMGTWEIQAEFIAPFPLDIKVDDYIIYRQERYNINVEYEMQKVSNFEYRYSILFEHVSYWLKDKILMHQGAVEFSYFGTAAAFVGLIVENMNLDDTGWSIGNVVGTEPMLIEFYGDEGGFTCKGALMRVAEEFGMEFWFTGKQINLTTEAGVQTNLDFEYGQTRGLYSLTRGAQEQPLYNRLWAFGGRKNINFDYRNGAKRLVFEERMLEMPLQPGERRRENSVIFEDIYPTRTGTVSAVSENWLNITDGGIDFDLNGQRVEGETAKIVFKSGNLSGREYDIGSYNHSTKTITLVPFTEEDGYTTPNSTFNPSTGDQYTLVGISMPQSYIDDAEARLRSAAQGVFNQVTRPPYEVEVDEKYMRDNGIVLNAGDRVRLRDQGLNIDDNIRVFSVSWPLVNPYDLTAVISDAVVYRTEVRQEIEIEKSKERVTRVDRTKAELARQNTQRMRQLQGLIFDPDGYFDPENIKPGSIETLMLSVGAKSQNFALNGVEIAPNAGGDPNSLFVSGGFLIHYELEIEGLGYIWEMSPFEFDQLDPLKPYFLSARVSQNALTGTWHLSEDPVMTESEAGFWHFNVGILYAVKDGYRGFDFTNGMTFIVGDTIRTGTIQSIDGLVWLNLTDGSFKFGSEGNSIDWNVTEEGQLTIDGALVSKMIFAENAEIVNLLVSSLRTANTGKRVEITEQNNSIRFYNEDGVMVVEINDTLGFDILGNQLAGIAVDNPENARSSFVAASGILSNASLMPFFSIASGLDTNASVVGILNERNSDTDGISAGVVGLDPTTTGASRSFGGYFNSALIERLKINSIELGIAAVTENHTMTAETYVSCYNTSGIQVNLPANPRLGRKCYVRRTNSSAVTVGGNGEEITDDAQTFSTISIPSAGDMGVFVWDGTYWCYNVMQ